MKISLIIPIYKRADMLRKFLSSMGKQTNNNFELVFCIDTNIEKVLEVVDEFKTLKTKMNIIYNSKRQGRTKAIKSAIKFATGEYSIIISLNTLDSNFIENSIKIVENKNTDIIEFGVDFKQPKKISGDIRKEFKKSTKILDHPEIIALSYPFDFNKFYRTELLKNVVNDSLLTEVNSRFTLAIIYKALMLAETYSTISKKLITFKVEISQSFNPLKLMRQWKEVFKYNEVQFEGKYNPELLYAKYFHEFVFLLGFTNLSKNEILLKKVHKKFSDSLETEYVDLFESNKYALQKNKETEVINNENWASLKITKIFRELNGK